MKSHTRTRVLFSPEFKEAVDRLQDKEKEIDSLVRRADRIKTNRREGKHEDSDSRGRKKR